MRFRLLSVILNSSIEGTMGGAGRMGKEKLLPPPPQGTLNGRGSLSNPGWAWYGKVAEIFDEANWIYFWCKRI